MKKASRTWGRLFLTAMLATAAVCRAQATEPAQADTPPEPPAEQSIAPAELNAWPQTLAQLANVLAEKDVRGLTALVGNTASVRSFASEANQPIERLLAATMGGRIISIQSYVGVPLTLATDLAADLAETGDVVSPDVRARLTPNSDATARRANEIAATWVARVLQPGREQPVGVIVVWPSDRRYPNETVRRPIFVLIKAQPRQNGELVIRSIYFGDPLEPLR